MQRFSKALIITIFMISCLSSLTPLFAWRGFYSDDPSMRQIERADSLTGFDVTKYTIHLKIDDLTREIQGRVIAEVLATEDLPSISYELEGSGLQVDELRVNGIVSAYNHADGIIQIPLSIPKGESFTTDISYSGVPSNSPAPYNIGLIFTSSAIYTLSNPDAGRYYWPCYDHPWDKALVEWQITVRDDWLAAANGTRLGIVDNGDGTRTHHWQCNSPVATYVMGFAAGSYIEWWQDADGIPIQNFVLPTQLSKAQVDFANTPAMIQHFSDLFGAYPFEKYGHMLVPMTTYAAMEHQTMTTFGARYLTGDQQYESIVAHELAHQWYGNYLTPITMREVWLKESFATYSEFLWEHHKSGWEVALRYLANSIQQYYISWENTNRPRTIFNPEYNQMFAPPTYEKSASVLHMLRLKMGNEAFFEFIRALLTQYPNSNINTSEFIALAESFAAQDLTQFFQQWIYSPGIPDTEFMVFHDSQDTAKIYGKSISPTATDFYLEMPAFLPNAAGADSLMVLAEPNWVASYYQISSPDDLQGICFDPNHWLLCRNITSHTMKLTAAMAYNNAVDLLWESVDCGIDISSYRVYRRLLPNGLFQQINEAPVNETNYVDTTVRNGCEYEYYVCAVDAENFESLPSNIMLAKPLDFPFDLGTLVINETRSGNGSPISPTHAEVEAFYNDVLDGISYTVWNTELDGIPTLADLARHPLIFWHSDEFANIQILELQDLIASYLLSGGKMIIGGWKYPAVFSQSFLAHFLPGIQPVIINSASFCAAHSPMYPSLYPDPDKLAAPWNGMLPMSYVFSGAQQALYYSEIHGDTQLDQEPSVIRLSENTELVLIGFPLYFMQKDGVKAFLPSLMAELSSQTGQEAEGVKLYPNPLSRAQELFICGQDAELQAAEIYNIRGQKLDRFTNMPFTHHAGAKVYQLPAGAFTGYGRGVYFVKLRYPKTGIIKKVVIY